MLFSSLEFILFFLPAVLAVGALVQRRGGGEPLAAWIALASLFFYAWWDAGYLPVIVASIGGNFLLGRAVARHREGAPVLAGRLAAAGIALNLLALGAFKYAGFAAGEAQRLLGWDLPVAQWVLPIGISFFTFQQISYLIDLKRGEARQPGLVSYAFAVTFFPHLIAGPIVRYSELLPQIAGPGRRLRITGDNLVAGFSIFTLGLLKKVLIADAMIRFADPAFDDAAAGQVPLLLDAWIAALAYTLQIYFDFSAYSDMAVGLARMLGLRLPANFSSPYKAISIVDFWRRWHITLSRFLRDYLYIPLGGSRKGPPRRYLNLILTMVLGGLWHGAGWTFLLWGLLHGLALAACHLWRDLVGRERGGALGRGLGWAATFLFVLLAWVPFRAADWPAMERMFAGLLGRAPGDPFYSESDEIWPVALALAVAWLLPNVEQVMARADPVLVPTTPPLAGWRARLFCWAPNSRWALTMGVLFAFAVSNAFSVTKFLYFDF